MFIKTSAQSARPYVWVLVTLPVSLWMEQTKGGPVNSSVCVNDVLSHRPLGKYSNIGLSPRLKSLVWLLWARLIEPASGGPNHPWPNKMEGSWCGICSRDWMTSLCHPPILLLIYPLHRQLIYTECCGGVRLVVMRCFWDVDGCEWWFRSKLTGSSNTRLRVTQGPMWSVIWSVECMSSRHRAAHLITNPQDVLQDFSPVYSAGYHPCLAYLWAHGAGLSHTWADPGQGLVVVVRSGGWGGIMAMHTASWKSIKSIQKYGAFCVAAKQHID